MKRQMTRLSCGIALLLVSSLCHNAMAEGPKVRIGGALRFSYKFAPESQDDQTRLGRFAYDVFRLNADASYRQFSLTADYRLYSQASGGGMLKYGYGSYTSLDKKHQIQLGLVPVPFGILPYASNSFLFNINYLLGFEDDSDMGIRYNYKSKGWEASLAFYKNADWLSSGATTASRFGFDVGGRHKEINQLNLFAQRSWGTQVKHQLGASGMIGGLYNIETKKVGRRDALALHYTLAYAGWKLKTQYTRYNMLPKGVEGEEKNSVVMTAFGGAHRIASHGDGYLLGLSYRLGFGSGALLDEIIFYNDFSMLHKRIEGAHDTYQNILGAFLVAGPIEIYCDWMLAHNHPDIGSGNPDGFAKGLAKQPWNNYININFGYYF